MESGPITPADTLSTAMNQGRRVGTLAPRPRSLLRLIGFVHITGLPTTNGVLITSQVAQRGRWDECEGKVVVVTKDGEVWIGATSDDAQIQKAEAECLRQVCPNGRGIDFPDWEGINTGYIIQRSIHSDYNPDPRHLCHDQK